MRSGMGSSRRGCEIKDREQRMEQIEMEIEATDDNNTVVDFTDR
jgi:hypothetical protein